MDKKSLMLVKKAKAGDSESFVLLLKEYEKVLYGTAKRILINEEYVADALQNTFLKGFEQITNLRKNQYFNTWLCRILINECYAIIDKEKKYSMLSEGKVGEINYLEGLNFQELVSCLDIKYRVPITLFYYSGYSIKEISQILDLSENTVKTQLRRGKQLLEKNLSDESEGVVYGL